MASTSSQNLQKPKKANARFHHLKSLNKSWTSNAFTDGEDFIQKERMKKWKRAEKYRFDDVHESDSSESNKLPIGMPLHLNAISENSMSEEDYLKSNGRMDYIDWSLIREQKKTKSNSTNLKASSDKKQKHRETIRKVSENPPEPKPEFLNFVKNNINTEMLYKIKNNLHYVQNPLPLILELERTLSSVSIDSVTINEETKKLFQEQEEKRYLINVIDEALFDKESIARHSDVRSEKKSVTTNKEELNSEIRDLLDKEHEAKFEDEKKPINLCSKSKNLLSVISQTSLISPNKKTKKLIDEYDDEMFTFQKPGHKSILHSSSKINKMSNVADNYANTDSKVEVLHSSRFGKNTQPNCISKFEVNGTKLSSILVENDSMNESNKFLGEEKESSVPSSVEKRGSLRSIYTRLLSKTSNVDITNDKNEIKANSELPLIMEGNVKSMLNESAIDIKSSENISGESMKSSKSDWNNSASNRVSEFSNEDIKLDLAEEEEESAVRKEELVKTEKKEVSYENKFSPSNEKEEDEEEEEINNSINEDSLFDRFDVVNIESCPIFINLVQQIEKVKEMQANHLKEIIEKESSLDKQVVKSSKIKSKIIENSDIDCKTEEETSEHEYDKTEQDESDLSPPENAPYDNGYGKFNIINSHQLEKAKRKMKQRRAVLKNYENKLKSKDTEEGSEVERKSDKWEPKKNWESGGFIRCNQIRDNTAKAASQTAAEARFY